ncbi:hypothetical protein K431DRAFT_284792 [Polychaeton citri CBS 116435]|uniref:Ribosomal protein S21 n=1 Tax=Polychaeton citri CBS 116435 TaxID=1314669 RepID=A0A9P4UQV0_9PEZI|nr:hypothetical protein K431DRAFT_284792 [Polychaeton citri CBS 116435]
MDILRAGEMLARSSQLLSSSIAPVHRAQHALRTTVTPRQQLLPQRWRYQAKRSFTASVKWQQLEPESSNPQKSTHGKDRDMTSFLDENLDFLKPAEGQDTEQPSRPSVRYGGRGQSSVDDILGLMGSGRSRRQQQSTDSASMTSGLTDFANLLDPNYSQHRGGASGKIDPNVPAPPPTLTPSPVKLGPSVGRTVNIDPARGFDASRAFRQLEMNCNRNGVKRHAMRQRFHERPGLKRKRLHSERWRRRFKEGFRETVKMVQRMKRQGW